MVAIVIKNGNMVEFLSAKKKNGSDIQWVNYFY